MKGGIKMSVKTYQKGIVEQLSANFRSTEFDCHGKGCCGKTLVDDRLVNYLQQIRDHFGVPVIITSGYRCLTHNANVGGTSGSTHFQGMAADIQVKGVAPAQVAAFAESIGIQGIGLYESDADGWFVHIDTRSVKCFWYGQAQQYRSTFGGAAKGANCFSLSLRKLEYGDEGDDVMALQMLLIARGYDCGRSGADGKFGAWTTAALRRYQQDCFLQVDGIAGEETMRCLLGVTQDV